MLTVKVYSSWVKVALTVLLPSINTVVKGSLPLASPLHWLNVEPGSATAVKLTSVP